MGCGCGNKTGYTQSAPLVLGEPNGAPAVAYRTTVTLNNMRPGTEVWATGSGVAAMAQNRWITPID